MGRQRRALARFGKTFSFVPLKGQHRTSASWHVPPELPGNTHSTLTKTARNTTAVLWLDPSDLAEQQEFIVFRGRDSWFLFASQRIDWLNWRDPAKLQGINQPWQPAELLLRITLHPFARGVTCLERNLKLCTPTSAGWGIIQQTLQGDYLFPTKLSAKISFPWMPDSFVHRALPLKTNSTSVTLKLELGKPTEDFRPLSSHGYSCTTTTRQLDIL